MDAEYNRVKITTDSLIAALGLIQRSDGALANGSVGVLQLSPALSLTFLPPTQWATATVYALTASVFINSKFYICQVAHTSGVFATDLAAGKWYLAADFTATVASGALVNTNNLSDVTSLAVARVNLGIDSVTTHGNSDYAIASTDRYVATSAGLSAPRTWTLPLAANVNAGQAIVVGDAFGGITSTNTLTVARNGGDTLNGGTGFIMNRAYQGIAFRSDGVSKWFAGNPVGPIDGVVIGATTPAAGTFSTLTATTSILGAASMTTFQGGALPLRGYLAGCNILPSGGATNFSVSAGTCASDDGTVLLAVPAITKTAATTWVVGNGNGGIDAGSLAATTWYHVFAIMRPDTGVVDILFSTSATAPTLPTGYTKKRRLGSVLTNASPAFLGFVQDGDNFLWTTVVQNYNAAPGVTTAVSVPLNTPLGVKTNALFLASAVDSGTTGHLLITSLDQGDVAANATVGNTSIHVPTAGAFVFSGGHFNVRTDLLSSIRIRTNSTTLTATIVLYGFSDFRGRFT